MMELSASDVQNYMMCIKLFLLNDYGKAHYSPVLSKDQKSYLTNLDINASECINFVERLENVIDSIVKIAKSQFISIFKKFNEKIMPLTSKKLTIGSILGDDWEEDLSIFKNINEIKDHVTLDTINPSSGKKKNVSSEISKFYSELDNAEKLLNTGFMSQSLQNFTNSSKINFSNSDDDDDNEDGFDFGQTILNINNFMENADYEYEYDEYDNDNDKGKVNESDNDKNKVNESDDGKKNVNFMKIFNFFSKKYNIPFKTAIMPAKVSYSLELEKM